MRGDTIHERHTVTAKKSREKEGEKHIQIKIHTCTLPVPEFPRFHHSIRSKTVEI
jgi:hypothetical protein